MQASYRSFLIHSLIRLRKIVSLSAAKTVSLPKAPVKLPSANNVTLPPTPSAVLVTPPVLSNSAPIPVHKTEESSLQTLATKVCDGDEEEEEEEIDETDPLWKVTLQLAKGDRAEAIKMLEDPDALMAYPEVVAALAEADKIGNLSSDDLIESPASISLQNTSIAENIQPYKPSESSEDIPKSLNTLSLSDEANKDDVAGKDIDIDTGDIKECDPREHLNIVFIGHVDAGKSTLSGSILYILGFVDQRMIEKYEREAKQRNRESWFLAFILDTSEEERARGKTVEVGRAYFSTVKNRYTILDAPGHKNYVPNMIAGASQADIGVLVISARKGEFETGFEKGGQTREHALLAKTLGIQYLVVVINKMDDPTVDWSLERYEECVGKLKPFLKSCGYVIKRDVKFLPISALTGANVNVEVKSEICPWWKGLYTTDQHNTSSGTLLDLLDSFSISGRNAANPLRIPVLDRYYERGTVVLGKVESGTLTMGDEIAIAPTKKNVKCEAIFINEEKVRSAKPGENVLIKFNTPVEDFQKGFVLCHRASICPTPRVFTLQLFLVELLEHRPIFSPGYEAVLHIHTLEIEVQVVELVCIIDPTGKKTTRPFAKTGQQCVVKVRVLNDLNTCLEKFDDFPALGRATLRDEGRTIAIGKVVGINKDMAPMVVAKK